MSSTNESMPWARQPRTHEDGVLIGGIAVTGRIGLTSKDIAELEELERVLSEKRNLSTPVDIANPLPAEPSTEIEINRIVIPQGYIRLP